MNDVGNIFQSSSDDVTAINIKLFYLGIIHITKSCFQTQSTTKTIHTYFVSTRKKCQNRAFKANQLQKGDEHKY